MSHVSPPRNRTMPSRPDGLQHSAQDMRDMNAHAVSRDARRGGMQCAHDVVIGGWYGWYGGGYGGYGVEYLRRYSSGVSISWWGGVSWVCPGCILRISRRISLLFVLFVRSVRSFCSFSAPLCIPLSPVPSSLHPPPSTPPHPHYSRRSPLRGMHARGTAPLL